MSSALSRKSAADEIAEVFAEWYDDPARMVLDLWPGTVLEDWQREACGNIAQHNKLAIRSGHGVGKSTLLTFLIFWFGLTRNDAKIPITAPAAPQIEAALWPEIRRWHQRLGEGTAFHRWVATQIEISNETVMFSNGNMAIARTARPDKPEALQGIHAENLMFLVDEASGVEDIVYETAQGSLSTPGAKIVLTGNPTRPSGYFYDAFHTSRGLWRTMKVSCLDVSDKRVDKAYIDDIKTKWGEDSNVYRVRVLGEFPLSDDQAVIPLHLCEAAVNREVEPTPYHVVWGVDVARFGSDSSALAKRRGNTQLEPVKQRRGLDTMQVVGWIMDAYKQTDEEDRPEEILVDVIGLGAGVVDRGRELGLPVRGINVAESASSSDRFMRLRDELWFKSRDWLAKKDCRLCDDQDLIGELTAPLYTITSAGKLLVESKDEMKKRGVPSPNCADAWNLTFAGGLAKIEVPDRWRNKKRKSRSWMTV